MIKKLLGRQHGFTLLELLIVIVIIGILATIVVPGLVSGPQRARDAQRKADLRSVKNSMETYYNDNNSYISQTSASTTALYTTAIVSLVSTYIPSAPCDPRSSVKSTTTTGTLCSQAVDGSSTFRYGYRSTSTTGYKLCATLENAADPDDGAGNSNDAYSITGVNGAAPGTC